MRVFSLISLGALALSATVSYAAIETYANIAQQNRITNIKARPWSNDGIPTPEKCSLGDVLFIRSTDGVPDSSGITQIECFSRLDSAKNRLDAIRRLVEIGPDEQFNYRLEMAEKDPENHLRDVRLALLYSPVGMPGSSYIPSGILRDGLSGDIPLQVEMIRGQASLTDDERTSLLKYSESEIKDWLTNSEPSHSMAMVKVLKVLGFVSEVDLGGYAKATFQNAKVHGTKDPHTFLIHAEGAAEVHFIMGINGAKGIPTYTLLKNIFETQDSIGFKSMLDQVVLLEPVGLRFTTFPAGH